MMLHHCKQMLGIKEKVKLPLFMIHNIWSVNILFMGTLASGSQTSILQKTTPSLPHSIIS